MPIAREKLRLALRKGACRVARHGLETRRINVDFSSWMVEARRLDVTRQSIFKMRLTEWIVVYHSGM